MQHRDRDSRLPPRAVHCARARTADTSSAPDDDVASRVEAPYAVGGRIDRVFRWREGRRYSHRLRFGDFEFDTSSRDLVGPEGCIRLPPQPARLLTLLVESSGIVISRETVRRHLWPEEIHVEFDQSINTCIKRLRSALDDRAETPRYIETVPRLGYRFLEPVTHIGHRNGLLEAGGGKGRIVARPRILIILVLAGLTVGACLTIWRALATPPCGEEGAQPIVGDVGSPPNRGMAADSEQPHP